MAVQSSLADALASLQPYGTFLELDAAIDIERDHRIAQAAAVIVVRGVVALEVQLAGVQAAELLGAGDVAGLDGDHLPEHIDVLRPLDDARVFALDQKLPELVAAYPAVGSRLLSSSLERHRRQGVHRAILQLPAMEDRILGMAWLLAQRWGTVTPDGVRVDLALTHATFARLVGGSRSTVTSAISALEAEGLVRRDDARRLVLSPESRRLERRAQVR